jgi:hypothetical protein
MFNDKKEDEGCKQMTFMSQSVPGLSMTLFFKVEGKPGAMID